MSDEFDWSPLGEPFWRAAAESCSHKPTEAQLKFAVGRHNGLTALDAVRRAGYTGDPEVLRGKGSRVSKTTAVTELLAYAFAETGTGDDGVVKGAEPKRILSRIARTGDNASRIRAVEGLQKIEQSEREARLTADADGDWRDTLKQIAALSPEVAMQIAVDGGHEATFELNDAQRADLERRREMTARGWIERNAEKAQAYIDMALRGRHNGNGEAHDAA